MHYGWILDNGDLDRRFCEGEHLLGLGEVILFEVGGTTTER